MEYFLYDMVDPGQLLLLHPILLNPPNHQNLYFCVSFTQAWLDLLISLCILLASQFSESWQIMIVHFHIYFLRLKITYFLIF